MTKAKMDYLWAPKDEKIVSGLLDHLGIEKVGDSNRYPTGVKYDTMIAISNVLHNESKFASMVASATHALQSDRAPKGAGTPEHAIRSLSRSLSASRISEAELKVLMKKAGLI